MGAKGAWTAGTALCLPVILAACSWSDYASLPLVRCEEGDTLTCNQQVCGELNRVQGLEPGVACALFQYQPGGGCALEAADWDGDGQSPQGCAEDDATPTDCNEREPRVAANLAETCDGLDNDCDGWVDEGVFLQTDKLTAGAGAWLALSEVSPPQVVHARGAQRSAGGPTALLQDGKAWLWSGAGEDATAPTANATPEARPLRRFGAPSSLTKATDPALQPEAAPSLATLVPSAVRAHTLLLGLDAAQEGNNCGSPRLRAYYSLDERELAGALQPSQQERCQQDACVAQRGPAVRASIYQGMNADGSTTPTDPTQGCPALGETLQPSLLAREAPSRAGITVRAEAGVAWLTRLPGEAEAQVRVSALLLEETEGFFWLNALHSGGAEQGGTRPMVRWLELGSSAPDVGPAALASLETPDEDPAMLTVFSGRHPGIGEGLGLHAWSLPRPDAETYSSYTLQGLWIAGGSPSLQECWSTCAPSCLMGNSPCTSCGADSPCRAWPEARRSGAPEPRGSAFLLPDTVGASQVQVAVGAARALCEDGGTRPQVGVLYRTQGSDGEDALRMAVVGWPLNVGDEACLHADTLVAALPALEGGAAPASLLRLAASEDAGATPGDTDQAGGWLVIHEDVREGARGLRVHRLLDGRPGHVDNLWLSATGPGLQLRAPGFAAGASLRALEWDPTGRAARVVELSLTCTP